MKKITEFLQLQIDLNSVNRRFYLVFFTIIFAFFFLNFFQPFGLYYDKSSSNEDVFIELFMAMMVAFFVLLFTQFILRKSFKVLSFSVLTLLGWFAIEALLVGSAWTGMEIYGKGVNSELGVLWVENFIAFCLVMLAPYFFIAFLAYHKDSVAASKRSAKQAEVIPSTTIPFKDDAGIVKLVLDVNSLLYIQSADNYVEIHHFENEKVQKFLLRNTIKNIEVFLNDFPVIRCHRSFMINTSKIESAHKTSSGFSIHLQNYKDKTIPVSRSYVSELQKYIG